MLFVLKREQVEHARLRALAQAIVEKEKAKDAFDEYMKVAFPWLATQKRREDEESKRALLEEVKKGGLAIRPLWEHTKQHVSSRLHRKVVTSGPSRDPKKTDDIYRKMGKALYT